MLKHVAQVEIRDQEGMCGVAKLYFEELFEAITRAYEPVLNLIHLIITTTNKEDLTTPLMK